MKRVGTECWGRKRFRIQVYENPPPGNLLKSRTKGTTPFEVIGVDFAGPIRYNTKEKWIRKSHLVLYGCSLARAVQLEVLKTLELSEFLGSLKRFFARRGHPKIIYSDNGATFKAASKWLKQVQKDERLHDFLATHEVHWKFNLSLAPWWGGQYERLIGLFKSSFYKQIGCGKLTFEELVDVVLDVEVALNNRPLSYIEDDVELSVLTPNAMMNINSGQIPELEAHHFGETDLRRSAKLLKKCKEAMRKRWLQEYIRSLRERHLNGSGKKSISYTGGSTRCNSCLDEKITVLKEKIQLLA